MATQNTRARIVIIMALVIIGVALLATGIPFVGVTFWVLLLVVPLLATLRLVLNLLDGAAESTPAPVARVMALVISGVALLATGVSAVFTLWSSSLARFMLLEDLGLEGTTAAAVARVTPVDRGLFVSGGILAILGVAAVVAAAVLARQGRRAERS